MGEFDDEPTVLELTLDDLGDAEEATPTVAADPELFPEPVTAPHASLEWLDGYENGYRRGVADALGALRDALLAAGVRPEDVEPHFVDKVRRRIRSYW